PRRQPGPRALPLHDRLVEHGARPGDRRNRGASRRCRGPREGDPHADRGLLRGEERAAQGAERQLHEADPEDQGGRVKYLPALLAVLGSIVLGVLKVAGIAAIPWIVVLLPVLMLAAVVIASIAALLVLALLAVKVIDK